MNDEALLELEQGMQDEMGTITHTTFAGQGGAEFRVALGDVLAFEWSLVGRVVRIEEGEWRFSGAPKLRLLLEVEDPERGDTFQQSTLLHPQFPEQWPRTCEQPLQVAADPSSGDT